jgi:hypothetical protein
MTKIEIVWDHHVYEAELDTVVARKQSTLLELEPKDGVDCSVLIVDKWFPTNPPRPIAFRCATDEEVKANKDTAVHAKYVKAVERKVVKRKVQRRSDIEKLVGKDGRVRADLDISLDDMLSFTRSGFEQYVDSCILGNAIWGQLEDMAFEVKGHSGNNICIAVNAGIKK